jgi:hypothetical protein
MRGQGGPLSISSAERKRTKNGWLDPPPPKGDKTALDLAVGTMGRQQEEYTAEEMITHTARVALRNCEMKRKRQEKDRPVVISMGGLNPVNIETNILLPNPRVKPTTVLYQDCISVLYCVILCFWVIRYTEASYLCASFLLCRSSMQRLSIL